MVMIIARAGLKGDSEFSSSMAGSLLKALGGDGRTSVEDLATITPDDVETTICESWMYSDIGEDSVQREDG